MTIEWRSQMRLVTSIFLLCFFLAIPASANVAAPERHQSLLRFPSFQITTTNLQERKHNALITFQINHDLYRVTLAETLAYQFLSLAFVVSLFYLYTHQ